MDQGKSVVHTAGLGGPPLLRFVHYNDVYHVESGSRDPVGGISRFKTLCRYYQDDECFEGQPECLTLFSGDAFNPSLESSVTKGKHMVPVLNSVSTSAACLGNHDLDFGVNQFQYLASLCAFPWLCSNVLDPAMGKDVPLGRCKRSIVLTASNGVRIGVIGLVEREWLDTINSLPPNLTFLEPEDVANEFASKLRTENCDIVIALTHQRQPNDERLARSLAPGTVDIILGGHDHFYAHTIINGTHVLRSGTDFQQLSYIEGRRKPACIAAGSEWDFDIIRRDVVLSIPEDPEAISIVAKLTSSLTPKLQKPIGYTAAPLDARFTTVRLKESNLGNFVCDLMRCHYDADCCIIAAGTIRGDQVYPPGILKLRDLKNCFPFEDPCVVIGVTGAALLQALENAVSKHPALEGRFPQVAGITLTFDPSRTPGQRCTAVSVGNAPLQLDREYKLVTREYMVRGKDGFRSLQREGEGGTARSIVSEEGGMLISTLLRQYFASLKVLGGWEKSNAQMAKHWEGVQQDLHKVHPVREPFTASEIAHAGAAAPKLPVVHEVQQNGHLQHRNPTDGSPHSQHSDSEDDNDHHPAAPTAQVQSERELLVMRKVMRKWRRLAGLKGHSCTCEEAGEELGVHWTKAICPRVEGRIKMAPEAAAVAL